MKTLICICLLGVSTMEIVRAGDPPAQAIPADNTLSPNKRYGITVPPNGNVSDAFEQTNDLVDMKSKRVIGWIDAQTAFVRMNHSELLPA